MLTAPECPHPLTRSLGGGRCMICEARSAPPVHVDPDADSPLPRGVHLTPEQRVVIARRASAARMKRSLSLFVQRGWCALDEQADVILEWEWYHDAFCDHIQAILEDWLAARKDPAARDRVKQRIQNMVANLPPGTLKSRILMVYAIAWMWLRAPTWKVLCISSNPENVTRDAELCRDLVGSPWYVQTFEIPWRIRTDIDAKKKYKLTAGGERIARGLIAKFTGVKAHAIFLDDPDDAHDVFSPAARKERASKWENAIFNRVTDRRVDVRIGLQQRVHEDDWSAQVLRQNGWFHFDVPQEYTAAREHPCACGSCKAGRDERRPAGEPDDRVYSPIGWADPRGAADWSGGPLLHPSRFTPEDLDAERTRLGSYGYQCQHNQRPESIEGGMFKRSHLRFFRIADEFHGDAPRPHGCLTADAFPAVILSRVQVGKVGANGARRFELRYGELRPDFVCLSVDASHGSLEDTASRCALVVIAGFGALRFVLHDSTRVRSFGQTLVDVVALAKEFGCTHVLVENKANGRPVIEVLKEEVPGLVEFDPRDGSKESRASAMMPSVEAGQLALLDGAAWLDEFVAEFCLFPSAKHDDRVDAVSQCHIHFRAHEAAVSKWRKIAQAGNTIPRGRV